jgi:polar amino acid transport system permease protein
MGLDEFLFLLRGLQWTLALTAVGFAGGAVAGLAIALARTSANRTLRRASAGYIALFQGTPLLMQLFVVYYGLALGGVKLDAWVAVAIGFTLHASAFLGEIWRGSVEAVPRPQWEAAECLALTRAQTLRKVILPQAARIAIAPTVGFLVQVVKGTSLASVVGFVELTRAGQIVNNSTFQPFLVFSLVGAIYFALCYPLSRWSKSLERRLDVARG